MSRFLWFTVYMCVRGNGKAGGGMKQYRGVVFTAQRICDVFLHIRIGRLSVCCESESCIAIAAVVRLLRTTCLTCVFVRRYTQLVMWILSEICV